MPPAVCSPSLVPAEQQTIPKCPFQHHHTFHTQGPAGMDDVIIITVNCGASAQIGPLSKNGMFLRNQQAVDVQTWQRRSAAWTQSWSGAMCSAWASSSEWPLCDCCSTSLLWPSWMRLQALLTRRPRLPCTPLCAPAVGLLSPSVRLPHSMKSLLV